MRVLSVPLRLRLATGALTLAVPVAALQVIVVARAPWWKLPYRSIAIWSVAVALICLPLGAWLASGRTWALRATGVFGAIWCVLSAWVSYRMRHYSLAFYTLFLTLFWTGIYTWLKHELGRSFFDPRLRWYQGLPRPIPGLRCRVAQGDLRLEVRVARLDEDGAFVFGERGERIPLEKGKEAELHFTYKDREARCLGIPIRSLDQQRGAGLQFTGMVPDSRKRLGDFVEALRGEGHV